MIWIRRFLALILVLFFVPSLLLTVLALRVNDTVLEPEFWIEELQKADVYNFTYDDVLPLALDDALAGSTDIIPVDPTPLKDEVVDAAREILPPEWLQEQAEVFLRTVPPYLLGDIQSFELTVAVKDRVETMFDVVAETIGDDETFVPLYDEIVAAVVEEAVPTLNELRFPLPVSATAD